MTPRKAIAELPDLSKYGSHTSGDGVTVQPLLPYGIGIDTHRDFIQVCVLIQSGAEVVRYEREFHTTWPQLKASCDWATGLVTVGLQARNIPIMLHVGSCLRFTIESTGCYHYPVVQAWRGSPSIINPQLAGATKRKTDVLDARMLAHHSMCGLWPKSFVPPPPLRNPESLARHAF